MASRRAGDEERVAGGWAEACEVTARKVLRRGFDVRHLEAMTSIELGGELRTGVVLVVSAGRRPVRDVHSDTVGVAEGIRDMARDGLDGRMILYGLGFHFLIKPPR
ncbi:hypothetical protein GGS23DRAFT_593046 [Durotheca rogersii]|uniref:uncharacterized protein n=1 Tax=Durotheca rogersii TaxID=419775 RepID=UPI00221F08FB|nr:uncharacterized protein GGS23DRAFT_593046 [Durotheca rogersii]KAI5867760.1 hypothetical protein GGS23DRAFT_593046 [Durotheca rogersii]